MLKALLWKEWHEQRWRVALATVWLLGMSAIGFKTRVLSDDTVLWVIWLPTSIILPMFFGMGLFASERKNRTFAYLMVQPVSRGSILTAKVISGLLAYLTPMIVSGVAVCLAVGGRELKSNNLIVSIAALIALGAMLLAWQLLAGLRCRREETYVLVSAIVLGCWIVYAYALADWRTLDWRVEPWLSAANPFSISDIAMVAWGYWPSYDIERLALMQSLILAGLGLSLWLRFRRLRESRS
jgi:ABC-type transport system involved in multi-copper enzyme maturation permease subunit